MWNSRPVLWGLNTSFCFSLAKLTVPRRKRITFLPSFVGPCAHLSASASMMRSQHSHPSVSENMDVSQQIQSVRKRLKEETKRLPDEARNAREVKWKPPPSRSPPDEKITDPMRRDPSTENKHKAFPGPWRNPTEKEREKQRRMKLRQILDGKLEFKRPEPESAITVDCDVDEISVGSDKSGVKYCDDIGGIESQKSRMDRHKDEWPSANGRTAFWTETKRERNTPMSKDEWSKMKELLYKALEEPPPNIKEMDDKDEGKRNQNFSDILGRKSHPEWQSEKQTERGKHIENSWDFVTMIAWKEFKQMVQRQCCCRSFEDLIFLCDLINKQQTRILNEYLHKQRHRAQSDLFHHDIQERELWSTILDSNYMLMMDALQQPYYLRGLLDIFEHMQRNAVQPITHLTALCHLKIQGKVLLSATARPQFVICLSNAGLFENRIASLIMARHTTGDYAFSNPKFWLLHLEYLHQCLSLSPNQVLMLTK